MATIHSGLTRRGVLIGVLGTGAGFVGAQAQTAQPATRFRAVRADVEPLIAIGGRGPARIIAQVLPGKLASSFADALVPGDPHAPVVVAQISHIFLSSYADTPAIGFGAMSNTDFMDGSGVIMAGRQVLLRKPLRVSLPAGYSGTWYLPDIDEKRIVSLCESFASWLRREFDA